MGGMLVTGARGRLGSALFAFLSAKGEDVTAIFRSQLELSNESKVKDFIRKLRPSLIFHPAAMTNVDECERFPERARRDNVAATHNLAQAAAEFNARLVYFSTDYVFDGKKSAPYVEKDVPNPLGVYGQTKLAAERLVSSTLSNHIILRVSWLFGAQGDFVSFVKGEIDQGRSPRLTKDHRGAPGYIPDLLPAIYDVARSGVYGIFHLTNKGDCTRLEMGKEILKILGSKVEPIPCQGKEVGFIAPRPEQSVLSCEKFRQAFGYDLRPWQEALYAYLEGTG
jgi:dTDP-4-dehydrorhamnose reductase